MYIIFFLKSVEILLFRFLRMMMVSKYIRYVCESFLKILLPYLRFLLLQCKQLHYYYSLSLLCDCLITYFGN